jgi:hypothetical protein
MARASLCIVADDPAQVQAAEDWFAAHRHELDFLSVNYGCGCCVDLYDIDGPDAIVATLPPDLRVSSEWTRGELTTRREAAE